MASATSGSASATVFPASRDMTAMVSVIAFCMISAALNKIAVRSSIVRLLHLPCAFLAVSIAVSTSLAEPTE
ncbi:unannotated protein [freshwater metagenome]|uniref:Unannotated protein n=1 Tax=freshwater metagenome TaxID=449393 RepID=A0A6J7BJB8_9ZZZZ